MSGKCWIKFLLFLFSAWGVIGWIFAFLLFFPHQVPDLSDYYDWYYYYSCYIIITSNNHNNNSRHVKPPTGLIYWNLQRQNVFGLTGDWLQTWQWDPWNKLRKEKRMKTSVLLCWVCGDIGVRRPSISWHCVTHRYRTPARLSILINSHDIYLFFYMKGKWTRRHQEWEQLNRNTNQWIAGPLFPRISRTMNARRNYYHLGLFRKK